MIRTSLAIPVMTEAERTARGSGFFVKVGTLVGRSLFPIVALLIILGTALWGPWVTLILTAVLWRIVTKVA